MMRGFTIVELLIVIGVIVLLMGITVAVMTTIGAQGDMRRTETTLRLLDVAMTEWERAAERELTWGTAETVDIHEDTPYEMVTTVVLRRLTRSDSARSILDQISPDRWVRLDEVTPAWVGDYDAVEYGTHAVLDAWDTPIYTLHPGARPDEDYDGVVDDDGTEHTYNERTYGTAVNRDVCFISAGPDGEFGIMEAPPTTKVHQQTDDNVFSYRVKRP